MRRSLVRIVGLALCASALTGCGMLGGDSDSISLPSQQGAAPVGADLTAAVRQAQLLRTNGDLAGATRVLSQLMLAAPDDARVVGEYGKLLVQQGQTSDAIEFLNRAIELQPGDWTLYSALGVAYDQLNDHPNAKVAYERGLSLKPGEPAILNNYAMSRMLSGDTVAARTLMLQAQAGGSTDPRIAKNLALLDSMAPPPVAPVAAPPRAVATALPPATHTAPVAPRAPVIASNALPPVAHGAPTPIAHGGSQVVMQDVPFDPLAGPVGHGVHPAKPSAKPTKLAKPVKPVPRHVAANVPPKNAKPAKPAKDRIPALRMTADAGKP